VIDAYDVAKAEAMITGYHYRWGMEAYEVLAVEAEYRAPLLNPETGAASRTFQRGGKLDVILREPSGRTVFMEHKTTAEDIAPGSSYWRQLAMNGQVTGYFLGAEALGLPAEACIYDVLGKPAQRPLKVSAKRKVEETPDEYRTRCIQAITEDPRSYYQRGEVVRLEAEMAEGATDDWLTAAGMRETQRLGHFPRNPDACFKWGRACEFWDVCTGTASLEDATRFRRIENMNPELEARPGLPVLSASRLHAARACARLHRYRYIDGIRPVQDAETLSFGSLIHRGLEAWWRAEQQGGAGEARLDAALAALRAPGSAPGLVAVNA
jgi:PD-(D/E)XK nuclease superfamily